MNIQGDKDLFNFLSNAPKEFRESEKIKKYQLKNGDYIHCVLWNMHFYITGTDIVKILVWRFQNAGRQLVSIKKFEEGVFSDLRNLKPGIDATLEGPRSDFLEFLYKNGCIRTQKKQKVFFWYSVPHDALFCDALERDLRRETNLYTYSKYMNNLAQGNLIPPGEYPMPLNSQFMTLGAEKPQVLPTMRSQQLERPPLERTQQRYRRIEDVPKDIQDEFSKYLNADLEKLEKESPKINEEEEEKYRRGKALQQMEDKYMQQSMPYNQPLYQQQFISPQHQPSPLINPKSLIDNDYVNIPNRLMMGASQQGMANIQNIAKNITTDLIGGVNPTKNSPFSMPKYTVKMPGSPFSLTDYPFPDEFNITDDEYDHLGNKLFEVRNPPSARDDLLNKKNSPTESSNEMYPPPNGSINSIPNSHGKPQK
ncbi:Transcription factor steA [Astathelohania contejeani]|uniref:Transcription factor steA n=1 Tax=Astathelohania contejeani TaxID=164912 RepID=A0ABQ7I2R5_9MICR|nr:Transcription factor steA [Thelohania contejeani]